MLGDLVARVKKAEADRDTWKESSANWQALYQQEHDALAALRALLDSAYKTGDISAALHSLLSTSTEGNSDD